MPALPPHHGGQPHPPLSHRSAGPEDIPVIRRLAQDIWWQCYRGMIPDAQISYMLDWMYAPAVIAGSLSAGTAWELVELEGQPVGFISWSRVPGSRAVQLNKLYLDPAHHGKGLGQRMLARVREAALAAGADRIELRVNRRNETALKAYRRAGFQQLRDLCEDIGNGFVMDDHVLMLPLT